MIKHNRQHDADKRTERPLSAAQQRKVEQLREKIRERARQRQMAPDDVEIR